MIDGDKDAPVKIVDHLQRLGLIVSSPNWLTCWFQIEIMRW
jgi:hypothetical protein